MEGLRVLIVVKPESPIWLRNARRFILWLMMDLSGWRPISVLVHSSSGRCINTQVNIVDLCFMRSTLWTSRDLSCRWRHTVALYDMKSVYSLAPNNKTTVQIISFRLFPLLLFILYRTYIVGSVSQSIHQWLMIVDQGVCTENYCKIGL